MKTYNNLPDYIALADGAVLKPVIGGMLNGKPFIARVSVNEELNQERIVEQAKRLKLKHRRVGVKARYQPSIYIFVQVNEPARLLKDYTPRR